MTAATGLRRLCVFCGSSPGARPEYRAVLLARIAGYRPPPVSKWIDRATT